MPETRPASVQVCDLTKRYGAVDAVRGVDLKVRRGEIFGLLGRNGAGKTTTLECILGLRRPDAGTVTVEGVDVIRQPRRAREIIGAQLQGASLQDALSPREALRLFCSFHSGADPAESLLEAFNLQDKADAPFRSLSGGQKQRLFLALALVHRPRVLVLDEPTSGLDPHARRELHRMIEERRRAGVTVLLSTHDLDEAGQLCDRIGILHDGRLVAVDTPATLTRRSRKPHRLRIVGAKPLDPVEIGGLKGVVACTSGDGSCLAECADINEAIVSVGQHLSATGNALLDLQTERPTLEDVFVELTGTPWDREVNE